MAMQPDPQPSNPAGGGDRPKTKSYDRTIARWTIILGCSTIVLSIATVVSAYFLHATDETLKNQARIQLRAYVGIGQFIQIPAIKKEEGKPDIIQGANIGVAWKNYGATPANSLEQWVSAKWYGSGLEPDFSVPDSKIAEHASVTLGPGGEIGSGGVGIPIEDFQKAVSGNGHVFVWGDTQYKDAFPDTPIRHSHFCVLVQGKPPEGIGFRGYKPECNYSN